MKSNTALTELNLSSGYKRRHTKDTHQQFTLSLSSIIKGNGIGDTGATSLSEALKSNTTLTALYLGGEDKRKKDIQKTSINNSLFSSLFTSTDDGIGFTGATLLSEALKSNTALTDVYLSCEDERKTHKRHPSAIHSFHFLFSNSQQDWRQRSGIIW